MAFPAKSRHVCGAVRQDNTPRHEKRSSYERERYISISNRARENKLQYFHPDVFLGNAAQEVMLMLLPDEAN